jgi:NAD(P)-dependent dehydrogenase (short-subunit alcohol dehydrogenase family)
VKRILITGAASGLGLALAKKYAREGWSVCIADIQDEEGIKVAAHLNEAYSGDCFFQHLDITSDTQWQELVSLISERWQGLDALVNGLNLDSIFEFHSRDHLGQVIKSTLPTQEKLRALGPSCSHRSELETNT